MARGARAVVVYPEFRGRGAPQHDTAARIEEAKGLALAIGLVVVEATGVLAIPAAGTWTFCFSSDDGCSLQIRPPGGTYTTLLSYPNPRGIADSLGSYAFPSAGPYEIRAVLYENNGGSGGEVSARQGSASSWDATFKLIGDTANGGLAVSSAPVGAGTTGYLAHVGADVKGAMLDATPRQSSCYVRYAFTNPGGLASLTMPLALSVLTHWRSITQSIAGLPLTTYS